jgi:flagellar motor protein MotB
MILWKIEDFNSYLYSYNSYEIISKRAISQPEVIYVMVAWNMVQIDSESVSESRRDRPVSHWDQEKRKNRRVSDALKRVHDST